MTLADLSTTISPSGSPLPLVVTSDPLDHLQWQIDRLRTELLSLQVEFERTRSGQ